MDVERNLRSPLVGIEREASRLGLEAAGITIGIRTGDTPPAERARLARRPPDILITTPESLFLMLTSQAREALRGIDTVILDEVHAIAGTKRGAHLALSLERLDLLLERPAQRIGLSATVSPLETVASFVRPSRPATVVAPPSEKQWDLQIRVPVDDMAELGATTEISGSAAGSVARTSIWPHIDEQLVDLIEQHRTTLVFANSRRLAERITAQVNEIALSRAVAAGTPDPQPIARAHHGSVSKEQRALIEEDLKAGRLPAVVATSSLELGIDMGTIDLVVQVETPPSVASGLQRVGRAGHQVGAVSRGIIFPKYRGDLVTSAVVTTRMRAGRIEDLRIPRNPLDVLAQQIVACVSMDDWTADDLLAMVRRAAPFTGLSDALLDSVLDMLSGRYPSDEFAELRPRLVWDRDTGQLSGRPGAQRLAVTSGGTIPDRGLFGVFLVGEGASRVGELDEEMVYESRVGDVIALGASSWRIEDITHDRVLVSPAPGQPGRMPFWHGDALGRPAELGRAVGAFVREVASARDDTAVLAGTGLDERASANLRQYIEEQREATAIVPSDTTIVVERFRDELGDWRVVVHTPFGAKVHAPWALVIGARIRDSIGIDAQVMHADDGIVLRLPDVDDEDSARSVMDLITIEPEEVEALVTAEVGGSALFASRFRECAARALLLPRRRPDRRTPLWQQRQRSAHLLGVASDFASFPIILETVRECLQDVYDVPALREIQTELRDGRIRVHEAATDQPSPFAQSLLFGYVASFIYEGDSPLAERRAQALTLDPGLLAELLGSPELRDLLDADALDEVEAELQRLTPTSRARDLEDAADLLRILGPLSDAEAAARGIEPDWLASLCSDRRAIRIRTAGDDRTAAIEDAGRLRDALGIALPVGIPDAHLAIVADPLGDVVGRYARTHGPFTAEQAAAGLGLPPGVARDVLSRLASSGRLVRGEFRPLAGAAREQGSSHTEYCDVEVLRRIRRRSIARLRHEIEPVPPARYAAFLPRWQRVSPAGARSELRGVDGCYEVIEQLAGTALPASTWLRSVLPARVDDVHDGMLDELIGSGDVVWWGVSALSGGDGIVCLAPTDRAPLLRRPPAGIDDDPAAVAVADALGAGGALFFRDLADRVGAGRSGGPIASDADLVEALWRLVWAGAVTNDGWSALRARISGARPRTPARRGRPGLPQRSGPPAGAGRWSLLPTLSTDPTVGRHRHGPGTARPARHRDPGNGRVGAHRRRLRAHVPGADRVRGCGALPPHLCDRGARCLAVRAAERRRPAASDPAVRARHDRPGRHRSGERVRRSPAVAGPRGRCQPPPGAQGGRHRGRRRRRARALSRARRQEPAGVGPPGRPAGRWPRPRSCATASDWAWTAPSSPRSTARPRPTTTPGCWPRPASCPRLAACVPRGPSRARGRHRLARGPAPARGSRGPGDHRLGLQGARARHGRPRRRAGRRRRAARQAPAVPTRRRTHPPHPLPHGRVLAPLPPGRAVAGRP